MTLYLTVAALWTAYMTVETYLFSSPKSRPYFVGFLITEFVLMPVSLAVELMEGGRLRKRLAQLRRWGGAGVGRRSRRTAA
jgi:hypothetical protein